MTAFDRVVAAFTAAGLAVDRRGDRASAQAPGHSPVDRSVSITAIDGRVLIYSHAGERTQDLLAAVGLRMADLFDDPAGARYDYPDGRTVWRTPDKRFRQGGNTRGRALFHADRIGDAPVVYIVEGEQDVLAVESAGGTAVSPAMGAGKARLFDWTPLRGRDAVIVADKDGPGRKHAAQVAALLDGIAKSVRIVAAAAGKDAADHIAAGHSLDEFVPLEGGGGDVSGRRANICWAANIEPRRQRFLWQDRIPVGTLSAWAGRGGVGKTTFLLYLLAKITRGTLPGEYHGTPRPVLIWSGEDDWQTVLVPRLIAADADLNLVGRLSIESTYDGETAEVTPRLPLDVEAIARAVADTRAACVLIDPIASTMAGDLHREADVRQALDALARMAAATETTILFVRHFKKGGGDVSDKMTGNHAFRDAVRSLFLLAEHRDQPGHVVASMDKGNYSPELGSFAFRLENVTVPTVDGPACVARVVDLGACEVSVRDLINGAGDEDSREIDQWLRNLLANGPVKANDVYTAADAAGYSKDQAKRAKKRLQVRAVRRTGDGPWFWELPTADAHQGADQGSTPKDSNGCSLAPLHVSGGAQGGKMTKGAQSASPAPLVTACTACGAELEHPESLAAGLCTVCRTVTSNHPSPPPPGAPTAATPGMTERVQQTQDKQPSPVCRYCGDPLEFADDRRDGYHTDRTACVAAHRRAS